MTSSPQASKTTENRVNYSSRKKIKKGSLIRFRQVYPPEREALGVVAIGIDLIDLP